MENIKSKINLKLLLRIAAGLALVIVLELLRVYTCSETENVYGEVQYGELRLLMLVRVIAVLCWALIVYKGKIPKLIRWGGIAVAPALAFVMLEYVTHLVTNDVPWSAIMLNLVLYYLVAVGILFLFRRTDIAVTGITVLAVALGYVSYYVSQFRGTPLLPWDITSAGTAMKVVENYSFSPTPRGLFVLAVAILQIILGFKCNEKIKLKWYISPAITLCCALLLVGAWHYIKSSEVISRFGLSYDPAGVSYMYKKNGFAVSFILSSKYAEKPEGYSITKVEEIVKDYESDAASDTDDRPNVIVIMNESWSDPSVLCDFETSEPISPFIDSLEENTIKGWAHVSVLGGNTPNSEFEFLTGLTMGFLPQGVIAYQQYVNESIPTLVTQFNDMGYVTYGAHAFWSSSWKRNEIYPKLGFQNLYFKEQFPDDAETMRLWITDSAMYKEVEKIYESSDEPLFLFGITMNNHGGYNGTTENFDPYVYIEGLEDNGQVREYMTLMRESDKAFEELVSYFANVDEKTVILMFGDHQPLDYIADAILENAGLTMDYSDTQQLLKRYTTPYIIWANYDIDYDAPENISLNYLGTILMEVCGFEETAAQKYLLDLMEDYPIISAQGIVDSEGNYTSINDYEDVSEIMDYSILQYNTLLDKRNRVSGFWELAK